MIDMNLDQAIQHIDEPPWKDDEAAKRAYGLELAKLSDPFEAGLKLFNNNTRSALWVVANWVKDPIVEATKNSYLEQMDVSSKLLDKSQLAAKLLHIADEKHPETNLPILKGNDRLTALKLYSEVMGFINNKNDSKSSATAVNEIKITLVGGLNEVPSTVIESTNFNENNDEDRLENLPVKIKLVK